MKQKLFIAFVLMLVLGFSAWFFLFDMYAALCVTAMGGIVWLKRKGVKLFVACVAIVVFFSVPEFLVQVHYKSKRFSKHGPSAFSTLDAAGIYGMHALMTAGGVIPFPEVALEAFLLQFGNGEAKTWESDFASNAEAVYTLVERQKKQLAGRKVGASVEGRAQWSSIESVSSYWDARVMLTIACYDSAIKTTKLESGFEHRAWCWVSYPSQEIRTPIPWLSFHEGLYRMLEDRGWMSPFKANWVWRTPKN